MNPYTLPWQAPLEVARALDDDCFVLLHSAVELPYSGRYSLLAFQLAETLEDNNFEALSRRLSTHLPPFENAWFGWMGYGLRHALERLRADSPSFLTFPDLWFGRFETVLLFDHRQRTLTAWSPKPPNLPQSRARPDFTPPRLTGLQSNFSKAAYMERVAKLIDAIHRGELYQANFTRKFLGTLETPPDSFTIFERLCTLSPTPYSAYIKQGNRAILSSSMERFLTLSPDGRVETRPIKGSAPRHSDAGQDAQNAASLLQSPKERAENLMIVDLMRNDLARACDAGSVRVEQLYDLTSHAQVHHLSSTVSGMRRGDVSPLELVAACFPPGSMTGAPKIRAMEFCARLEEQARGVYSGALGWFGGDGSCDLSVVIRTLLLEENRFEFQAGGGIVADSVPEREWEEMLLKAGAMAAALGIPPEALTGA